MNTAFLPDRFRPRPPHRRSSRPWVALVTLAAIPLVIPWWRVQAIEVNGFPGLPDTVTRSLEDLVGGFPLLVDPQWVRQQVEVWPVVETVDVRLELPGTLTVSATQVTPEGCLSVGRGWQAVAADGTLAGPLTSPLPPILTGFPHRPQELRRALGVVHVQPEETAGERFWCRCVLGGDSTMMWADLRWDDRVVAGGAS
jgi:hypothetical protein